MEAAFEVTEWARRADQFIEGSPSRVLRAWERRIRELRFDVTLPAIEEVPLRPLFVSQAFASAVLSASCAGVETGPVVMPSAIGVPDRFVVTEPPHGREWLLHAAYLDLLRAPWLNLIEASAPPMLEPLAQWFRRCAPAGTIAIGLSAADATVFEEAHVRVKQLGWWIEAELGRHGVAARLITEANLRDGGARLDDGTPVAGIAWWSAPTAPRDVLQWPWPVVARREVPALASRPHSPYAALGEDGAHVVYKPYDDPWAVVQLSDEAPRSDAGFLQVRPVPPVVSLPFATNGVVQWEDCHVELGVLGLEGKVLGAFVNCSRVTSDGLVDVICPAMVVP